MNKADRDFIIRLLEKERFKELELITQKQPSYDEVFRLEYVVKLITELQLTK